jgi:hypothetical protein
MGCCGEEIKRLPDMGDLPDDTYSCLARLAYAQVCMAEFHYTGRALMGWDGLPEAERADYVAKARRAPKGVMPTTPDRLFFNFVRLLMSAV